MASMETMGLFVKRASLPITSGENELQDYPCSPSSSDRQSSFLQVANAVTSLSDEMASPKKADPAYLVERVETSQTHFDIAKMRECEVDVDKQTANFSTTFVSCCFPL